MSREKGPIKEIILRRHDTAHMHVYKDRYQFK
jgi:hypothetical protein